MTANSYFGSPDVLAMTNMTGALKRASAPDGEQLQRHQCGVKSSCASRYSLNVRQHEHLTELHKW
jgi:hypothetical protein